MAREDHLHRGSDVSPYEALVAGSISGAVARAITAPLDTIKIRLQLQEKRVSPKFNAVNTVKGILRTEGVAALWKGNVPAEIMYILYGATQFTSYSVLNKLLHETNINLSSSFHSLIVGAGAGTCSTLTTYPFDLLRTKLAANSSKQFLSMNGTVRQIWHHHGVAGFFSGIRPTVLSVAANAAVMFWAYELARDVSANSQIYFLEGLCGFIAGTVAKGSTFPLDTLRKRLQVSHDQKAFRLLFNIVKNEGIRSLYKGFGVSLLKTAPTSALSIAVYEYSLSGIRKYEKVWPT